MNKNNSLPVSAGTANYGLIKSNKFRVLHILIVSAALLCAGAPALADTRGVTVYEVNSLNDPGSGVCDVAECTLREAISAASGAGGPTLIEFDPALNGTIVLGSQLFINFNGLTIEGPGPDVITVSGNNATRVLRIFSSDPVIRGLTIANGNSIADPQNPSGAGIYVSSSANPLLENLRIVDNVTDFIGGGVNMFFTSGTIRNCEVANNTAARGSGIAINGSDGHNVLVENTTISGNIANQAESGLNVLTNAGQTVTIRYVTVSGNTGAPNGASISGNGQHIIESSVFAGNIATNDLTITSNVVNNSIVENLSGTLNGANNLTAVEVGLGSLRYFEGSTTRVHPFGASPARDFVDNSVGSPGCGSTVAVDQRGAPRPAGLRCDAGAFEAPANEALAYWDFEELETGVSLSAGQRIEDISGAGRDARAEDAGDLPTVVEGRLGGIALQFESTPDRVVFEPAYDFGDSGPLAGSIIDFGQNDSFTLEALIRIPDGLNHTGALIAKDVGASQPSWWFRINGAVLQALVGDGANQPGLTGTIPVNDGEWHHVALVRDAILDELRLYVDYQLDVSVPDTTVGDSFTNNDIRLGAFNEGTHQLQGDMEYARISSGALTTSEFVPTLVGIDLEVTMEADVEFVASGDVIVYTLEISNIGDVDAVDAQVSDTLPAEIAGITWTCAASGAATCSASGSGPINETFSVPVGGSVIYTVTATTIADHFQSVNYSASAVVAVGQSEANTANNSDSAEVLNVLLFNDRFEQPAP